MAFNSASNIIWLTVSSLLICVAANKEIEEIIQFVIDGNKNGTLADSDRDFVLVLGKRNIGKTPFTMWLTMDDSLLISERKSKHSEFLVIDSEPIYPYLYRKANETTVYYDLPGIRGTVDPKYVFGTMYFIRNVVDHAKRVKILFVTDFNSVQLRGKRDIFLNSLRDLANFVKNPTKFKRSIAIIVTKVPNLINAKKYNDDAHIALIETFLHEVKKELSRKNKKDPLIQYIRMMEGNIGIFRYTDKSGPLSHIEILRTAKFRIEDIIKNKLVYVDTNEDDFGHAINESSKIYLNDLFSRIIKNELTSNIKIICQKIEIFYSKEVNEMKNVVTLNATAYDTCNRLKRAKTNQDPFIAAQEIARIGETLNVARHNVNEITNMIRYIKFLLNMDQTMSFTTPPQFIECIKHTESFILKKYHEYADKSFENLTNHQLIWDINYLLSDIQDFYLKTNQQFDMEKTRNQLIEAIEILKKVRSANEPHLYLTQLIEIVNNYNDNNLKMGTNPRTIDQITSHVNEIIFLSESKNKTIPNVPMFVDSLTKCIKRLEISKKWYDFLFMLYENLSENPPSHSTIAKVISQCGFSMKASELYLEKLVSNLKDSHNLYLTIRNLELTELEMRALKKVLNVLMSDVSVKCPSNEPTKMFVRGTFIRTSQIIEHECWPNAAYIELFALDSIIIDCDLIKDGEGVQVIMIAPKWQMSSDHKIELNGMNKNWKALPAADGVFPSGRGEDGVKGSDGDNGGDFFGIYNIFMNEQQLTIETNGGNAADGQLGGNGGHGIDGESPSLVDVMSNKCAERFNNKFKYDIYNSPTKKTYYFVYGTPAQRPGNGGRGGNNGIGGSAGQIELIKLINEPSKCKISHRNGERGKIGIGGIAGRKARDGDSVVVCKNKILDKNPGEVHSGINGDNGTEHQGLKEKSKHFENLAHIINDYKSFCRENLVDNIIEMRITGFQNNLMKNEKINKLYDTVGLVNELDTLEQQYSQLANRLSFKPYLESLLNRIDHYAQNENVKNNEENKKVLSYLYATVLSRLSDIEHKIGNNTIYDLNEFFNIVNRDILELRQLTSQQIIQNNQKQFRSALDEKIQSAKSFITVEIMPEFEKIFNELDDDIDQVLSKLVNMESSTQQAILINNKRKHELERLMKRRLWLAPLKVIAPLCSIFGGISALAGIVMIDATMIAENWLLKEKEGEARIHTMLPTPLRNSIAGLSDQLNNRYDKFKAEITEIDRLLSDYKHKTALNEDDIVQRMRDEVLKGKQFIKEMGRMSPYSNPLWTSNFEKRYKKLHETIESVKVTRDKRQNTLEPIEKNQVTAQQPRNENCPAVLMQDARDSINTIRMGFDVYNKYKGDKYKIKQIVNIISEQEKSMEVLKQRQDEIYERAAPYLRSMKQDVENFKPGDSLAEMLIKKWKLKIFFREMKSEFFKMSKEFSVEESIRSSLTKLEEGMNTIIEIYENIESYMNEKKLADYIANIGSAHSVSIQIHDPVMAIAVNRLEHMIKSNLIINKFKLAIIGTKQHYFPVIGEILCNYCLPAKLQTNDTKSIIEQSVKHIGHLQNKIVENRALSTDADSSMHTNDIDFDGSSRHHPAFYTWSHDTFKYEIDNLLQGNSVLLKADIENGVHLNAVKFRKIAIRFKSRDRVEQDDFDQEMSNFRLNMTLYGVNYYRCEDRIYSIPLDRKIELIFLYDHKDKQSRWSYMNDAYKKIDGNSAFLSPYNAWIVQFDRAWPEKFRNKVVDLQLIGKGSFLSSGHYSRAICDVGLDKYYTFEKLIST